MPIPLRLQDPLLRIPSSLYVQLCIPTRLLLGLALLHHDRLGEVLMKYGGPNSTVLRMEFLMSFVTPLLILAYIGLGYKALKNPTSWKSYWRTIILFTVAISLLAFYSDRALALRFTGLLLLVDAAIGFESYHFASITPS